MKTKLFAIALLGTLAFTACSTSDSNEYCSNPGATCPDDTAIDASACCTDQSCYWTYDNTKYQCNGTDCSSVLDQIITSACVSSTKSVSIQNDADLAKLKAQLTAVTEKLLVEARGASGCE